MEPDVTVQTRNVKSHQVASWELGAVGGPVVVIDVIRAFTAAAYAFGAGAQAIYLVAGVDDALAFKANNKDALAMGESGGRRPVGFDFSNSPVAISRADLAGRTIVQRTSAGTQGVVKATGASRLWATSLVCASATARAVIDADIGDPTYVITGCFADRPDSSGEDDRLTADLIERARRGIDLEAAATTKALFETDEAQRTLLLGEDHCDPLDIEFAARVDLFDFAMEVVRDERGLRLEQR